MKKKSQHKNKTTNIKKKKDLLRSYWVSSIGVGTLNIEETKSSPYLHGAYSLLVDTNIKCIIYLIRDVNIFVKGK